MRPTSFLRAFRVGASALALAMAMAADAQGDKGSLTEHFPNMSAKERSRIAAKESEEAQKDESYQQVMVRAEKTFQEGRYEEAIKLYEEARAMRPYNVYPKVKIEDLRALLARKTAVPDTLTVVEEHPVDPVPSVPVPWQEPEATATPPEQPAPSDSAVQGVAPPVEEPLVKMAAPPDPPEVPVKAASGIIERRYREGHAFVIERSVTIEGRSVRYKRVYHPTGQVFYFEDGSAVDERVWKARFRER